MSFFWTHVTETGSEDDGLLELSDDDFFLNGSSSDDAEADDEWTDKSTRYILQLSRDIYSLFLNATDPREMPLSISNLILRYILYFAKLNGYKFLFLFSQSQSLISITHS